jgi:hypothetical protein
VSSSLMNGGSVTGESTRRYLWSFTSIRFSRDLLSHLCARIAFIESATMNAVAWWV